MTTKNPTKTKAEPELTSTTCKLCNQVFATPSIPIIGEEPSQRQSRFVQGLAQHIQRNHPGKAGEIAMQAMEFNGYLLIGQFKNLDPEMEKQRDMIRDKLHAATDPNLTEPLLVVQQ